MGLFRKRARLRPLDERECYVRLHGIRSGEVAVVQTEHRPPPAPHRDLDGPTDASPALHLLIAYPRNAGRITGEQVRSELLRRMAARDGQAA